MKFELRLVLQSDY